MKRWKQIVIVAAIAYVASHMVLSRLSALRVKNEWAIDHTFLYLPISPTTIARHERPLAYIHWTLATFFWPVWKLDEIITGMRPMGSMPLMELSY